MPALDFLFLGIALGLSAGLSPGPLLIDLPIIAAAVFFVNALSLNFLFLAGGMYLIYFGIENLRTKSFHVSVKLGISSAWFKGFTANILRGSA